ncbi:vacuolar protein-sorting-associated protein 36 [Tribolium castaneum]|uniref:Vacuolar protein-sorting-associated protein 36 n=1 Tax=Tribolium castaneum TaxID=7070 RepID=D2A354_TRICA|nr:PREDICTED: vacuolar protein-sorting-associated protein 36 [Tribolium castaneum]EFA02261.1 Vacuolar protein-sorting-associated protein 36-like Protein [Tribolium castaneum]|eukprot:XP_973963.1 PREDICTED: vacuolar protein-sorting-associated protein 36 [Tribolium castaneum]
MNRWRYTSPLLLDNESTLTCEKNVRLYDGDQKTSFEGGELIITTHRILWGRPGAISKGQTCLALNLSLIVYIEEESPSAFSFSRSRKVLLHLSEPTDLEDGPQPSSIYNFIKLSFREGFGSDVVGILNDSIQKKAWEGRTVPKSVPQIKLRTGIVGIERSLQEKQKATDESISVAFQDLNKLMGMAKEMVSLSKMISTKIKDKQGDITEDETVRFKSYLLSLGIDDPVTRNAFKSDNQYYRSLAKEICDLLQSHIEDRGGMMALTDVFCWVNRARGLELLSPEDILSACQIMESMSLPLKLIQFSSGVMVLQLATLDDESVAEATAILLDDKGSLSSEELAQALGISVTLAKERLLTAEKHGKSCRDDSIEGLRFYPNKFLTN